MRVLTYRGLDIGRHQAAFDKVCAAIARDDLRSPDVKKLTGSPFFRAKLDDSNRLILQFLRHEADTVPGAGGRRESRL